MISIHANPHPVLRPSTIPILSPQSSTAPPLQSQRPRPSVPTHPQCSTQLSRPSTPLKPWISCPNKYADLSARGSELDISFLLSLVFLPVLSSSLLFFPPTRPPPPSGTAERGSNSRLSHFQCRGSDAFPLPRSAILLVGNPPPRARAASPTRWDKGLGSNGGEDGDLGSQLSGGENRAAGWQLSESGEWVMRFSIQASVHPQTQAHRYRHAPHMHDNRDGQRLYRGIFWGIQWIVILSVFPRGHQAFR